MPINDLLIISYSMDDNPAFLNESDLYDD